MIKNASIRLIGPVLVVASFGTYAQGQVVIGSVRYVCQNSCVVSTGSTGNVQVSDSKNGWVYAKHEGPAEVEVSPER